MNENDAMSLSTHGGGAVAISLLTAWLTRFFAAKKAEAAADAAAKQAQETNIRLAVLEKTLERVERLLEMTGELRERLALVEREASAAHKRLDLSAGKS